MKKVEKVASGANFAAVTVGKTEELNQYALPLAPGVEIPGKVFVGGDLQATGAEMSPAGRRSLRNTGDSPMTMICIQYKAASFDAGDAADGEILPDQVVW